MEMSGKNSAEKLALFPETFAYLPKNAEYCMRSPKILHYNNVDNCQGYSFLPFSTFGSPDTDARLLAETAYFGSAM